MAEPELQWIAEEFWQAPLPEGWSEYEDREGQPFYSNEENGARQWEHPLQRYYHGLLWMVKEGNALLEQRRTREPPEVWVIILRREISFSFFFCDVDILLIFGFFTV